MAQSDRLLCFLLAITAIAVLKVLLHDAHVLEHHDVQHVGRPFLPIVEEDVESVLKFITMKDGLDKDANEGKRDTGAHDSIDAANPQSPILPLDKIISRASGGKKAEKSVLDRLPSVEEVAALYGTNGPVIHGTETCAAFRRDVPLRRRIVAPAGMFNTGTNLMSSLLRSNCVLPHEKNPQGGMNWHVPWGKHNPVSWRFHNIAHAAGKGVAQGDVLPVVTIKDPYSWFGSMCRHSYAANWPHQKKCPNLVNGGGNAVPVKVRFSGNANGTVAYESLADVWNTWYNNYKNVKFPRLIVRFEDLLYRPEEVIRASCRCAGGDFLPDKKGKTFQYVTSSAKGATGAHSGASGLESALIMYSNSTKRTLGFDKADMTHARNELDHDLMKYFHYTEP